MLEIRGSRSLSAKNLRLFRFYADSIKCLPAALFCACFSAIISPSKRRGWPDINASSAFSSSSSICKIIEFRKKNLFDFLLRKLLHLRNYPLRHLILLHHYLQFDFFWFYLFVLLIPGLWKVQIFTKTNESYILFLHIFFTDR